MKNKIFLSSGAVLPAAAVSLSVCVNNETNSMTDFFNANVEALAKVEGQFCYNGGPGASQCEIEGGIEIAGYGVSATCSVTCRDGYYACCGIRCTCIKE